MPGNLAAILFDVTSCIDSPAFFLQPHPDDAALSCGGTVSAISGRGHAVHIVTLFADEIAPEMIGPFAQWKHSRWEMDDPAEIIETRRMEDAAAAEILRCSVRWLGFRDAIYRGNTVTCDDELFGSIDERGLALADQVVDNVIRLPDWNTEATVFVPMAIGSHLDHQIAFEVGAGLARQGHRVLAWEDAPYIIHTPEGFLHRMVEIGDRLGPPIVLEIEAELETKLQAIEAYGSQLPVIFRFTDDYRHAVTELARTCGSGRAAERFWPIL